MQNLYPLFERNRILKKELLWSLRDYSFSHIQLEYQEYGQGILQGCGISVQENELVVGPGMIKYGRFVCLIMEEERIHYEPADQVQYLKIKIDMDQTSPDYIAYEMKLVLDFHEAQKENEWELCRFNLRRGAQLRDQYKNFMDMETQYDTINLIHGDWAGLGGNAIGPAVTRYFAKIMLESENIQPEDRSMAYMCLNQSGAIPFPVLHNYISCRTGQGSSLPTDRASCYQGMCSIIREAAQGGPKKVKAERGRRQILVD